MPEEKNLDERGTEPGDAVDLTEIAFAIYLFIALGPPFFMFLIVKPLGAFVVSAGWLLLMGFALVVFLRMRNRIRTGAPAASIVNAELGMKMQNDRVLAGEVDGAALKAVWSPSGTRIDVSFPREEVRRSPESWLASLTEEQRVAVFEATESGEMEVVDGTLQIRTSLSFRATEDGADLVYRLRDAARIARALAAAGTPPDGCVGFLREERRKHAAETVGTLSLATPDAAQGAVSVAAQAGAVTIARKPPQST